MRDDDDNYDDEDPNDDDAQNNDEKTSWKWMTTMQICKKDEKRV